ncbi:MATE family efflux transporter [Actinomyces sp. B33]|uniref:MATE family efflux transporter n=1 Tax=Actinomyces sp. B33 TaxID=2942131 RepID=UPI002340BB87|nr:MATE family efflux transporter [Actinomyces sp. B33]MDC4232577.1 MATE family efflux transporter [Actinomyces sp. B33]
MMNPVDDDSTPGPDPQPDVEGRSPSVPAGADLRRAILDLAVPALGSLIAEPLFTLIDSAMVGRLGTEQLAGLGLASAALNTVVGVFIFLAYSTTSLAGRALGAGRPERALRTGVEAMWLAAGLGALAAAALALWAEPLLSLLGADSSTLPHAASYLRWSAPGLVGMFVVLAATGTLRGLQDTRTPLVVAAVGAGVNVVANAVLIYPVGLGVGGSGAGTALTQTLMALVLGGLIARRAREHSVPLTPSAGGIGRAAIEGAPLLVRTLALRAGLLATLWTAAAVSVTALASHQVVWTIWTFAAYVLDALAIAAQALVGYATGAGGRDRLSGLLRALTRWGALGGAGVGLVLLVLSPWLPGLFGADPRMQDLATLLLMEAAVFMPVAGVVYLLDGVLIGAGRGPYLAGAGLAALAAYLPALLLVRSRAVALDGDGQTGSMALLWLSFAGLYMGLRAATNWWATWRGRSPLIPRDARPPR